MEDLEVPQKKGLDSGTLSFREFIKRVRPTFRWHRHCKVMARVLQRVADDDLRRLMVFQPPRHGKSEMVSRLFPAYYLHRHPGRFVGLNCYTAELARALSRSARDYYREIGGQIRSDAAAVGHWETPKGGGLWAAGVGGSITGKGFSCGIIDDPVKNAEAAASPVVREKQKDWYSSTFYTREEPHGAIVIVQTRWNEDDLAGWLLASEGEDDEPERWHLVDLPAFAGEPADFPPTCTVQKDWRKPGDALCPERYPAEKLRKIERRIGSYFFTALYQGRPRPRGGEFFRVERLEIVHALPAGCRFVRYWDKAGTAGGGAYTAGVLLAADPGGRYFGADVVRGQWSIGERERVIRQTAELDRQRYGAVAIWVEQEPGSGGKESAENTVRQLAGFPVRCEPVTGDKAVRAAPFAAQVEAGNVSILAGDWNGPYVKELEAFPYGRHKDQVDASSGAFNKLAAVPGPSHTASVESIGRRLRW